MYKFFIIAAFVLFSAVTAAAQTSSEPKALPETSQVELAKRTENLGGVATPGGIARVQTTAAERRRQSGGVVDGRVLKVGPTTTYLKNGLRTEEVVRLLGRPVSITERRDGEHLLAIYTFERSSGRVLVAEFENGVLVRSGMEVAEAPKQQARRER